MNALLEYMKAAVEGRDGLTPYARWFYENDVELRKLCSRGSYIRLKRGNAIDEFRALLNQHGVSFVESSDAYLPRQPGDYSWIKPGWLTERIFPYQQSPTSFGNVSKIFLDELLHMIDLKQTGDELWRFHSPAPTWERKMGRGGIALVRGGVVVYAIITIMN